MTLEHRPSVVDGHPQPAGTTPWSFDPALVEVALSLARWSGARAEDAEDVAQEALLKLVASGGQVDDPVAWLFVVVRRLRHRQGRPLEPRLSKRSATFDPWPQVELSIDARRLLGRVSDRARRSVCLSLAGYTEREAAERLGCSVKATEKSLHKTRRRLRRFWRQPT